MYRTSTRHRTRTIRPIQAGPAFCAVISARALLGRFLSASPAASSATSASQAAAALLARGRSHDLPHRAFEAARRASGSRFTGEQLAAFAIARKARTASLNRGNPSRAHGHRRPLQQPPRESFVKEWATAVRHYREEVRSAALGPLHVVRHAANLPVAGRKVNKYLTAPVSAIVCSVCYLSQ